MQVSLAERKAGGKKLYHLNGYPELTQDKPQAKRSQWTNRAICSNLFLNMHNVLIEWFCMIHVSPIISANTLQSLATCQAVTSGYKYGFSSPLDVHIMYDTQMSEKLERTVRWPI